MEKIKLGVIFGGMSTENEVSLISGTSILKNLDRDKYEIFPIYIDKNGEWYTYKEKKAEIKLGEEVKNTEKIEDIISYLKGVDVIFPVLHGLYGEDGTIQGLFELLKKPYVGCRVLSSSVGMDKVYAKIVFDKAHIKQVKSIYIRKYNNNYIYVDEEMNEKICKLEDIKAIVKNKLKYPVFIKPSNSGSSVGVNKAIDGNELVKYVEEASKYDKKILIEQGIVGKEIECAVLGNEDVIASCVGEIKAADIFYSYDAKYNNNESKTVIPADISQEQSEKIRNIAIKAFKVIDGKGLARVDFFVENNTNEIYLNEVNTMPGFTSISMYPKLFEASGIEYKNLLDKLIDLAY